MSVEVAGKLVVKNLNLSVESGTVHAIMGPNGSGKSSLAYAIMGHPYYVVTSGDIFLDNENISVMSPHQRAKAGIFLAFQHPHEIPGVSVATFLREAYSAVTGNILSIAEFNALLHMRLEQLSMDSAFASRGLNEGFSGGEKKRLELLQLLILKPKLAILDEIDSGLDIDSLAIVAEGIALARQENPAMSICIITHYQRILNYVNPDFVHIFSDGTIVESGNADVAQRLEAQGYKGV